MVSLSLKRDEDLPNALRIDAFWRRKENKDDGKFF